MESLTLHPLSRPGVPDYTLKLKKKKKKVQNRVNSLNNISPSVLTYDRLSLEKTQETGGLAPVPP